MSKAKAKTVATKHPVEDIENFNWHPRAGEYDRYMQQLAEEKAIEAKTPFIVASKRTGCKFCGRDGLHWKEIRHKWYLVDQADAIHNCRMTPEPGDDIPF